MGRIMRKSKISIFSFCLFVIFLYPILPQYVYVVGGINMVNTLLAIFCFVYIFMYGKISRIALKDSIIFYWVFMIMMTIKYLADAGPLKAATYAMSFVLLPLFFISVIDTKSKFIKVIDTLIAAGLFLGILGLIESVMKFNFIQLLASDGTEFFHEVRYGLLRIMTTFGQPIAYGLYQVFIIVLINYRKGVKHNKRYLNICYVISTLNILLSVSRIPILAYIIIQILLIYRKSKKKFLNYMAFICVVALAGTIVGTAFGFKIPLVDDLLQTVDQLLSGNSTSSSTTVGVGNRFDLWMWVYLSMGNNWVWGNGAITKFAYKVYEWQTKTSIENQYLFILWHNGLVGLVLLILSYVSTLRFSWKRRHCYMDQDKEGLSFNYVVFILMAVYYVVALGVQETDLTRMYSIMIALLIAYNRVANKSEGNKAGNEIKEQAS